ncbi:MAG: ATP-binding cassette domain-containing protein [Oscillospiraceae bacterium]|nr:ATP-binding cassette domain-containing protein [Oscillospiraceae bacterium]
MILQLSDITKSYSKEKNKRNALESFTLEMTEGVYGLLGPNGAGKSTLINIITGIIAKDGGKIFYDCEGDHNYLSHLGFMPQGIGFYRNFTAHDYIKYIMTLKKYSPADPDKYAMEILEKVNLQEDAYKKIGAFSGGMKQRLGIAQAIVGDPKVLIFDEPTAGLDAMERIRFRNVISSFAADKIVILATHIVTDIAFIAKTVVLMNKGRIIKAASQKELCADIEGKVWELETEPSRVTELMSKMQVSNAVSVGGKYKLRVISDACPCEGAVSAEPSLEDVCIYWFGEM